MRTYFVASALILGCTSWASAQERSAYLSAGWILASPGQASEYQATNSGEWVQGVVLGIGGKPNPRVGVELSFGLQTSQSIAWQYDYSFSGDLVTSYRDVPVLGLLRTYPTCRGKACIEPVIGIGFTNHRATSRTIATCTPRGVARANQTCVPVAPPDPGRTAHGMELTIPAGVDIPFRVSRRVTVAPTFRFLIVKRREYLTEYTHRGPDQDSGLIPTFGVTVTWSSK